MRSVWTLQKQEHLVVIIRTLQLKLEQMPDTRIHWGSRQCPSTTWTGTVYLLGHWWWVIWNIDRLVPEGYNWSANYNKITSTALPCYVNAFYDNLVSTSIQNEVGQQHLKPAEWGVTLSRKCKNWCTEVPGIPSSLLAMEVVPIQEWDHHWSTNNAKKYVKGLPGTGKPL